MQKQNMEYRPLTLPKLEWNVAKSSNTYGEIIAAPLESGFGITLGNALRRVLLSSVEGSAVTAVIIKGVNNEFSTLPGVKTFPDTSCGGSNNRRNVYVFAD